MFSARILHMHFHRAALVAIPALALYPVPAFSQSASSSAAQQRPPAAESQRDPKQPEIQPPLDVDRDPVPSPDADVTSTGAAAGLPANSLNTSKAANSSNGSAQIQKQQDGVYVLRTNVDEVLVNCAVLDSQGHIATDLHEGSFRVWEDGASQAINSVEHLDLPVSMGILIDNSGSMRDKRATVNDAAFRFLGASNAQDEAFIVNFSEQPFLDQRFTTDRISLRRGISRSDPAGTTALYDAVAASADELAKHGKNRKQVLLIITDGADNASRLSLQDAIRRVQGLGGPVVYTIGLLFDGDPEESDRARAALQRLSEETGGVAYFPRSLEDVNGIATEVANDIREQYVVDYHSSRPFRLGGYRAIRIEATGPHRGNLVVRAKQGYYAQAEEEKQGR